MSDYEDNGIDPDEDKQDKSWRKRLQEEAREEGRREAQAEADAAKRELAFVKAGIDLENPTPQQKLFVKAYDGQPTVEAIKAAAVEYGVLEPATPAVPVEELEAIDRVTQASAGATTSTEADDLLAEMDKATSQDEVLAILAKAGVGVDTTRPGGFMRPERMGSVPLPPK